MGVINRCSIVTDTEITSLASAIRNKLKSTSPYCWRGDFIKALNEITNGGEAFSSAVGGVLTKWIDNHYDKQVLSLAQKFAHGNTTLQNNPINYIELSGSLTTIPSKAFFSMSLLQEVKFPTCTVIESQAFNYCIKLTSVSIPSCESLADQAFTNCIALESLSLPNCKTIQSRAFFNTKIKSLDLPQLQSVTGSTFINMMSLSYISAPNLNSTYLALSFTGCPNIKEIYMPNLAGENFALPLALESLTIGIDSKIGLSLNSALTYNLSYLAMSIFTTSTVASVVPLKFNLSMLTNLKLLSIVCSLPSCTRAPLFTPSMGIVSAQQLTNLYLSANVAWNFNTSGRPLIDGQQALSSVYFNTCIDSSMSPFGWYTIGGYYDSTTPSAATYLIKDCNINELRIKSLTKLKFAQAILADTSIDTLILESPEVAEWINDPDDDSVLFGTCTVNHVLVPSILVMTYRNNMSWHNFQVKTGAAIGEIT